MHRCKSNIHMFNLPQACTSAQTTKHSFRLLIQMCECGSISDELNHHRFALFMCVIDESSAEYNALCALQLSYSEFSRNCCEKLQFITFFEEFCLHQVIAFQPNALCMWGNPTIEFGIKNFNLFYFERMR